MSTNCIYIQLLRQILAALEFLLFVVIQLLLSKWFFYNRLVAIGAEAATTTL